MECGNPLPDGSADLLGVFRGGHLARADRPDRLVGNDQGGYLYGGEPGQPGVKLAAAVLEVAPRLPDGQRLADAEHRGHLLPEDRPYLGVDQRVVLVVVLAPLRVPGQHELAAQLRQHARADVSGVGAVVVLRHVLRAVPQLELVADHERLHAAQRGERRQHDDVHGREILVVQPERELLRERERLEVAVVHLPVAGDERLALGVHGLSSSAASPGRVRPSRYSRLAPPPVEMWLNALSGNSSCLTAAAESPPPTTVSPVTWLIASATAWVPAANAGNSNTPTGPFQKTVLASASLRANNSRVAGPMSRPSRSAGMAVAGTTSCSASAAKCVAATMSTGSTISTPRLA